MSTDNRFALLEVEEVDVKQPQVKNSPKQTTGGSQPTPLERKKQKEQQQKKNPNPPPPKKVVNTPPPDFDETGFKKVENKRDYRSNQPQSERRMSKQEFMDKKSSTPQNQPRSDNVNKGSPQQSNKDTQGSPQQSNRPQGGGNYRTRANKNINKNRGRIEDVNDKNPNRPDFAPKTKKFGEDKPPRKQGGVRTYEGNYRKKGTQGTGGQAGNRGRVYDKKSGTGLDPNPKKNEAGSGNWGDPINENLKAQEDIKKEELSDEYYPEEAVQKEGKEPIPIEKVDNVKRKGYNAYLQKLEKEKADLNKFLEEKKLKKQEQVEAPKIQEEKIPNLNKKITTDVPRDNETNFPRKPKEEKTEKKPEETGKKPEEDKTVPKKQQEDKNVPKKAKKVVPVTHIVENVKTGKKHRGINTIEELEKITGGSPKQTPKDDSNKQPQQQDDQNKDNQNKGQSKDNQTSWEDNKQDRNTKKDNAWGDDKQRRNDNYRGNNRDDDRNQQQRSNRPKVGRGKFDIKSSDDFPSLSDDIQVPNQEPYWVNQKIQNN